MKTSTVALALLPTLFSLSAARAAATDEEPAETVVAAASESARATAEDPNIDRAFLLPTAMTQPGGSGTYNNYELLLHGFTYGVTDHVQLTLTLLPPMFSGLPFLGIAAAKWQFVSTPRLHIAIQGSAGVGGEINSHSSEFQTSNDNVATLGGGLFASVCLRADCSSLISASATYQFAAPESGQNTHLVIYGGSIVHSVSEHVKLLGEVASMAAESSTSSLDNMPGVFVSYGVRLHNKNLASDIGFVRPILKNGDSDGFLMGLPFASISYRWM
jgi:hypothetical protein